MCVCVCLSVCLSVQCHQCVLVLHISLTSTCRCCAVWSTLMRCLAVWWCGNTRPCSQSWSNVTASHTCVHSFNFSLPPVLNPMTKGNTINSSNSFYYYFQHVYVLFMYVMCHIVLYVFVYIQYVYFLHCWVLASFWEQLLSQMVWLYHALSFSQL